MAYDRYVAICRPLHYGTFLGSRACVHMAAAAWGTGFLYAVLHTATTFSLPLCQGNAVDQFFCEVPQILKFSCSDLDYLREAVLLVVSLFFSFICFVFIVVSYVQIFRAVLRIPSEQGRHKAFSTCLPHLAVVSLFISTGTFAYLKPTSMSSPSLDLVVAVLYSVVPPAVNPLIYNRGTRSSRRGLGYGCHVTSTRVPEGQQQHTVWSCLSEKLKVRQQARGLEDHVFSYKDKNSNHHFYCPQQRLFTEELLVAVLDKGMCSAQDSLKTKLYIEHSRAQPWVCSGFLLYGSLTPRCTMVFWSGSLNCVMEVRKRMRSALDS
ncbi:olfactory receptor 14A16-like [Strix aluco]|uniref:olfactory receptor 14A16-like n=1 Tax=Strix aluco TaxID=111821 RepID=UPI003DA3E4BB